MKSWMWAILAIITYLFLLIAYLPAAQFIAYAQNNNPNLPFTISKPEGTLWSGRADKVITQGIAVTNFRWELSPLALLIGRASLDLHAGKIRGSEQTYLKGNVSVSLFNTQNITADKFQLFLPAKSVMAQLPLPVPVSADGRFRLDIQTFKFNQTCIELDGKGSWLNGTVSGPSAVIDFGNFDANLSCEEEQFAIQVQPQNKLNLDAKVLLSVDGKYKINGRFKPSDDMPQEVKQAANFFGSADAQGFRKISL